MIQKVCFKYVALNIQKINDSQYALLGGFFALHLINFCYIKSKVLWFYTAKTPESILLLLHALHN